MSQILVEQITNRILFIRGQRVMLDADLAELYGVSAKRLREQVRRNLARFPQDFMLQLTVIEKTEVITVCDNLLKSNEVAAKCGNIAKLKFSPSLPYVFTEHGAMMLANVLKSQKAVQASILVVRAFVRLRQLLGTHKVLAQKLEALEKKYDGQFRVVFDAIRKLMEPPPVKRKYIGFGSKVAENKIQVDKALT